MTKISSNSESDPDNKTDPYLPFDLSNEDILRIYLDLFISMPMTTTIDDDTSLSAGAVAGIVIASVAMVICIVVIVAVGIYCCYHCRQWVAIEV